MIIITLTIVEFPRNPLQPTPPPEKKPNKKNSTKTKQKRTSDVDAAIKNISCVTTPSDIHPRPLGPFCTSGIIAPRVIPVFPSLPVFSSNNIQIPVQLQCFEMHQISQFSKPHHVAFWEESIVHPGVNHKVKYFGTANALIEHENEVKGFHVKMRIVRTSLVCFFETFAGHFE